MKPANFPERKRQRQIRALSRMKTQTAGKPEKGIQPSSNHIAIAAIRRQTLDSRRDVRTKKDRSKDGRFFRAD